MYNNVLHSIAALFAETVDGLMKVVVKRNERNEPTDSLPPVLPLELMELQNHDFNKLLTLHDDHIYRR